MCLLQIWKVMRMEKKRILIVDASAVITDFSAVHLEFDDEKEALRVVRHLVLAGLDVSIRKGEWYGES